MNQSNTNNNNISINDQSIQQANINLVDSDDDDNYAALPAVYNLDASNFSDTSSTNNDQEF